MKQGSALHNRWLRSSLSLMVAGLMIGSISYIGVRTYKSSHAATSPVIYVSPDSGSVASGSTLSVTLREDSGIEAVNSVQASLNYDASKLSFISITESGTFPLVAATSTSTAGVIRVGRGNNDTSITGDNAVVTINFRVIGTSGSGIVSIDRAYSALVRSSDSIDILDNVGTGSYTISGSTGNTSTSPSPQPPGPSSPTSAAQPVLTLSPASGNLATGSPLSVAVRLNSYNHEVSTVESVVTFPSGQLQYTGVTEGGIYTTVQRTKAAAGSIDIIRAIPGGNSGVTGENTVVMLNFKVIGASGPAGLAIAAGSAVYDTSGTGRSILDIGGSKGAAYTLGATSSAPVTVVPLTNSADTTKATYVKNNMVTTPAQAMSIASGSGNVALTTGEDGAPLAELTGEVKLTPIVDGEAQQAGGIQKVEYYLDSNLIYTARAVPYAYVFDTNAMRNGVYTMGIKTYLANGKVSTKTDKLLVNNPVNLAYVSRHYTGNILGVLVLLVLLGALIIKLVLPRLRNHDDTAASTDHDALYGFSDRGPGNGGNGGNLVANDPLVVAPAGTELLPPSQPKFSSAVLTTDALPLTSPTPSAGENVSMGVTTNATATQSTQPARPVSTPRPIPVTDQPSTPNPPAAGNSQSPTQY